MRLGEILVARGLVSIEGVEEGLRRQKGEGGRLGENLVALGMLTAEALQEVLHGIPRSPKTLSGTALSQAHLLNLFLKFMYLQERDTPAAMIDGLKLSYNIVKPLFDEATKKQFVETLGSGGVAGIADVRYTLTTRGREAAMEALARNHYIGPAPVSLEDYQRQILNQRITNEQLDAAAIEDCFRDLVVPIGFVRRIGPAVNAGHTILLYGPPGNGKTSFAARIADLFRDTIYVPYAVEVEGNVIQIYDGSVHVSAVDDEALSRIAQQSGGTRTEDLDQRWIACERPTVTVGGELTLDMLDLSINTETKFYEAPMHVKALNGIFIVDDFGRQVVSPEDLLNRWIVPLENRVDYFKLKTGKSFPLAYDQLLIFSTNLEPESLMDPAFLRRIPYKIKLIEPSLAEYRQVFEAAASEAQLELSDDTFDYLVDELKGRNGYTLAYYQPKFIVNQVLSACKYEGVAPTFSRERVADALQNLYVNAQLGAQEAPPGLVELEDGD